MSPNPNIFMQQSHEPKGHSTDLNVDLEVSVKKHMEDNNPNYNTIESDWQRLHLE